MRMFSIFNSAARFGLDDRGTMTIMSLVLLSASALLGGLAVDVMRFENRRTQMQTALDLCVLNAASLRQTLDERTLFNDCVRKAGMTGTITNLVITEGYSSKSVTASAEQVVQTMFLDSFFEDMETLTVTATSSAMERVGNVEVALVLDVSGSMLDNSRLVRLKTAAKDFVETLMSDDDDGKVQITLVPFNGQVNVGNELLGKFSTTNIPFNTTNNPDVRAVRCVDLPVAAYSTSTPSLFGITLPGTAYVDTYSSTQNTTSFVSYTSTDVNNGATPRIPNMWCPPTPGNQIRLPNYTTDLDTVNTAAKRVASLKASIDALVAEGATSINAGMRWGLAMLDPSMREVYEDFRDDDRMPSSSAGRPLNYNDPDVLKVVVLMSDGSNFAEERANATGTVNYRSGTDSSLSPIWRGSDGNFSIFHTGRSDTIDHYVPHLGTWRATPYTNSNGTGTATQLRWGEVWERFRMQYVARQFYARPLGSSWFTTAMNMFRSQTPISTMDSQLQTVCQMARTRNVVVYTIAFEAPTAGQTQLRNCASTTSRYYVASTTTISQVFASIAGNISKLKLTQ